jgi:hypothetical protein
MLVVFRDTLVTWQSRCEDGMGAPYLLIISCVRHTCVVMVVPLKGDLAPAGMVMPGGKGVCCHVMLVVISHRPGFLTACAEAALATANRQQPNVSHVRVLRMKPPD